MGYNPRYFVETYFPLYFQTAEKVTPPPPPDEEENKVIGGGGTGTGFQRNQGRISVVPQGPRTYREKIKRKVPREEKDVIEFVVRFCTDYL